MKRLTALALVPFLLLTLLSSTLAQEAGPEWTRLNNQIAQLRSAGNHQQALALAKQALQLAERNVGKDHFDVAMSLNQLSMIYSEMKQPAQALLLQQRELAIWKSGSALSISM